jgi:alpha-1,3/alpha-1,6-mannosyltransferase
MNRRLRIAFVHPELGIGGAERLVLDAATCLEQAGHRVTLYTAHHDPCASDDGAARRLEIRSYGGFLPVHVLHRLRAPCNIVLTCYVATRLAFSRERFDVIFCDLVSATIPVLKLFTNARIIYYCHYPDRLLAPRRDGLYRWYRMPLDRLEEATTGMADRVLVNSRFTAATFRQTFARLAGREPDVVYPGVDVALYSAPPRESDGHEISILSLNRYERAKNVRLALEAFAAMRERLPGELFARVRLTVAGGFDARRRECHETLAELEGLTDSLALRGQVTFLKSLSEAQRLELLARCRCVAHTAEREHFGYVPVEAMAAGRPVVAVNNGGPAETVLDGVTGLLCPPTKEAFAAAIARMVADERTAQSMGRAAREHVTNNFSRERFATRLEEIIRDLADGGPARKHA